VIKLFLCAVQAAEAFTSITEKLRDSNKDYDKAKQDAKNAATTFLKIKSKRTKRFNAAFKHIDEALKTIYTDMTKSSKHPLGGKAYLSLDDTEEPYNGGLKFNAMPPMKRFRDMEQLSGGEKTVAALSLLFAIHSFHPAPFFVMDEVDAALDNVNLRKVCNYISKRSQTDFQCIVISLKDMFYERAQSLIGICKDVGTNSSRTLTLDLTQYHDDPERHRRSSASAATTARSSRGANTSAADEIDGTKAKKQQHRKKKRSRSESSSDEDEEVEAAEEPATKRRGSRRRSSEADDDSALHD